MSMGARVGLTWAALMMLGLASLWLNSRGPGAGVAFAAVIGVAAVKAFLVAWFFMHMNKAPRAWGMAFAGLIAALAAAIVILRFV